MTTSLHALLRSAVAPWATLTLATLTLGTQVLATLTLATQSPLPAQDTTVADRPQTAADPAATPLLWRIEGDTPSYLFGTIHLPDLRVNVPQRRVREALDAADAVFTEMEMAAAVMREVQQATTLDGGRELRDVLPQELYADLKTWLGQHGMPIQPFTHLRPWALMAQLPLIPHLRELRPHQPLDVRIYRDAEAAGKEVGGLETAAEQLAVFESFSEEQQVRMLRATLERLVDAEIEGQDLMTELIELYIAGDARGLLERMHEDGFEDERLQEQFLEKLLWERNERMAERIADLLADRPDTVFFFAVGAAHFPGERGILALLHERGLRVTRLPEGTAGERIRALQRENRRLRDELERLRAQLKRKQAG